MTKLTWLTDIHLNFLEDDKRAEFYQDIVKTHCDAVLISGDIAEATSFVPLLIEMAAQINKPLYFVLGNHDYYRGNVDYVRKSATTLTDEHTNLCWLPAAGVQVLNESTLLVGQDGWADGRIGDYHNSNVTLNDSRMIADLYQTRILGRQQLLEKMQQLANADTADMEKDLLSAITQCPKKIIALTHVPPFKEACQYEGKISDDNWLPYFSSKIMGDVLLRVARANPTIEFLVLCGHTHGSANFQPLSNLTVKAGHAEYYRPAAQDSIFI